MSKAVFIGFLAILAVSVASVLALLIADQAKLKPAPAACFTPSPRAPDGMPAFRLDRVTE